MHKDIYVIDGARTPFGAFGGAFKDTSATELGAVAARGALERASVDADQVDQVIFGNVIQSSPDAAYLARHVGLKAGAPQEAPALTVNRLCGSGLQAMISGAQAMLLDEAEVVLAGAAPSFTTTYGSPSPTVTAVATWPGPPRTSRRCTASRGRTSTSTRYEASRRRAPRRNAAS
jgi:acetyl-CoA acetyltransferase